jgi:putative salt-induced outer membrane protein YdiY
MRLLALPAMLVVLGLSPSFAFADPGTPPADQKALVSAPAAARAAPTANAPTLDSTTATVAAGGQLATGNSQLLAMTANGKLDVRRGSNGYGAAIIGNYGESALPGASLQTTTENFQGRLRYDRYVLDELSLFLIGTVRHDKFQGIDGRLNIDPGIKYLFVATPETSFWAELGYDFQYDARNGSALAQVDASGKPIPGAPSLSPSATDHSVRAFLGFKHAFNAQVTFSTGVEYLQSLYSSDQNIISGAQYDYRINYDALFAANMGAGLSLGLGFSARYDNVPLPGKQNTDTVTTVSLIYAFSDAAKPAPTCPCPTEPPPAPPPPPPPPPTPTPTPTPTATPTPTPTATPTPTPTPTATPTPTPTP